jgi:hypothetical protein
VNDDMVNVSNERTVIDADKMSPLSRLGGANYGALKESFSLKRPK